MSIGIEIVVVYRNITDASNLHGDFTNQGILAKFKALNKKKDPLLEAVLFENLITLNSTLIPMIVAGFNLNFHFNIYFLSDGYLLATLSLF